MCDGHGGESHVGATASERVAHVLPKLLAQGCPVKDAFERVDRIVCDMFTTKCCVGTTVALVHIKRRRTLSVAHVGDSRVMLIDADGSAITLTEDHSPNRPDELARIEREGGGVIHGRVNGVLAVSRAVGDTALKNVVPALPEESEYHLGRNDQLIVLATDGLWDMVSAKEVASFLKSLPLAPGSTSVPLDLAKAAEALVDKAVSRGSRDDTSVVLVDIRNV